MELDGKTALVTGGGSGIGLGVARALGAEGCRVAITGRGASRLDEAVGAWDGPLPLRARVCDVSDRAQVEELVTWLDAELGPLDILINNAGVNVPNRSMSELAPDDWDRMLKINATGTFNCIYAALPGMRQRGGGLIVNIVSIAGKRALKLAGVGYCASKFAQAALGATVGLEARADGVRVTNIYPGEVDTPILAQRPTPVPPGKRAQMLTPDDVAACVLLAAKLPPRVVIPELILTPLYQEYA